MLNIEVRIIKREFAYFAAKKWIEEVFNSKVEKASKSQPRDNILAFYKLRC